MLKNLFSMPRIYVCTSLMNNYFTQRGTPPKMPFSPFLLYLIKFNDIDHRHACIGNKKNKIAMLKM